MLMNLVSQVQFSDWCMHEEYLDWYRSSPWTEVGNMQKLQSYTCTDSSFHHRVPPP